MEGEPSPPITPAMQAWNEQRAIKEQTGLSYMNDNIMWFYLVPILLTPIIPLSSVLFRKYPMYRGKIIGGALALAGVNGAYFVVRASMQ